MKKSTKKQVSGKLHKISGHKYLKRAGIVILSGLAGFYLLYQLLNIVGLFRPI
jgi:hypothetical protein